MNVALLGFGTVGYGVYELLQNTDGITVTYILDLVEHTDITAKSITNIEEILSDNTVDTVIELIGGELPAYKFIKSSLLAQKNVITANKLVISKYYKELTALANEHKVALRYTAAVGGGIPWLTNLERMVRLTTVSSVRGIFNGTTNYILDAMHKNGTDYSAALKQAQKLGFAEADPSSDVDGLDTKRKIAISCNIAFGVCVDCEQVDTFGIGNIKAEYIKDFELHGKICKLIAKAYNTKNNISAFTEPTLVEKSSAYAVVDGSLNRISYDADIVGHGSFLGFGAGRYPTAYTVVNDCIDVANGIKKTYNKNIKPVTLCNDTVKHKYFVSNNAKEFLSKDDIEEEWQTGVITKEVSVTFMHNFASKHSECFIAGIN